MQSPGVRSSLLSCTYSRQRDTELSLSHRAEREPLFDWLKEENRQKYRDVHPKLLHVFKLEKQRAICKEYVYLARMY